MRFRHSVSLTVGQFSSVFKLLLYRLITGAVFFCLSFVILRYGLVHIIESAELTALKTLAKDFMRALFSADSAVLSGMPEAFRTGLSDFIALLGANIGSIAGSVIGVAVMYILARFFNGLALYALGGTVNDRMSTFSRTSFADSYFRSLGKASLYQLVYVPIAFVYDVLSLALGVAVTFWLPTLMGVEWNFLSVLLALSIFLTLCICLQALKLAVISGWMPAMIAEKKSVRQAIRETGRYNKTFLRRFANFLVAAYVIVIVNVVCAFATLGSALFLTLPMSYLFLIVMQFVHYYEDGEKKYFIPDGNIAGEQPAKFE